MDFCIRSRHSNPHGVKGEWVDTTILRDRFTPFASNVGYFPPGGSAIAVLFKSL